MHPILFTLGPITLYTLGIFIAVSLVLGLFLFWRMLTDKGYEPEFIFDAALLTIVLGIAGGRIVYVVLHYKQFFPNVLHVLNLFGRPGFLYYGALLGGAFALIWFCRQRKKASRPLLDAAVLSVSIAHGISLIGAFLSGTAYGAKTSLPWGLSMVGLPDKRHPVQLVESVFEVALFSFLYYRYRKVHQPGAIAFLYIVIYATGRIFIEFLRGDSVYWFGIKSIWFISLIIMLLALVYALKRDLFPTKSSLRPPGVLTK